MSRSFWFLLRLDRFDGVVVLLSALIFVGVANAPFKAKPFGDMDFHIEAKLLASFAWGVNDYSTVSITKAPGPVLFYFVPYFLSGPNAEDETYWLAAIIWNGIFMTLSLLMLRKTCANFGSDLAGKLAVFFALILPIHLYYSLGILAESLAFLACCTMAYGYSRILRTDTVLSWSMFATGVVGLVLARPNALLVVPLLILFFLWRIFIVKAPEFVILKKHMVVFASLIVLAVGIVSFVVKNLPNKRKTFDQETYLAYVAILGRYQFRNETWDWRFWDASTRADSKDFQDYEAKLKELRDSERFAESRAKVYTDFIITDLLAHPVMTVKQFFVRTIFGHTLQVGSVPKNSFGVGRWRGPTVYYLFHIAINLVNFMLLGTAVLFLLQNRSRFPKYLALALPWFALVVFHGFIYMEQRYLFPIRPVVLVLSSLFLAEILRGRPVLTKLLSPKDTGLG